jgi:hypothetical protein
MSKAKTILSAGFSLASLMNTLLSQWLTLGWKVRKARKAFEKELIREGMSKEDAERLSRFYKDLKDQIVTAVIHSFR